MTRGQFSDVKDFITSYKEAVLHAKQLKADIGPHSSALTVIHELRQDLPVWAATRQDQLMEDPSEYDWEDFKKLCELALALCESEIEINATAARNTKKTGHDGNNSDKRKDKRELKKRTGPLARMTAEKWIYSFLRTKTNKEGNCLYCLQPGHDALICYYIIPERRPAGWKPFGNMWAYYPPSNITIVISGDAPRPADSTNLAVDPNEYIGGVYYNYAAPAQEGDAKTLSYAELLTYVCSTRETSLTSTLLVFWIVDSGAACNMVAERAAFIELKEYGPLDTPYRHNIAGAGDVSVKGFGKVKIWIRGPAGNYMEFIINAMYNPDLDFNLLSTN
jgi:hypothetical protein